MPRKAVKTEPAETETKEVVASAAEPSVPAEEEPKPVKTVKAPRTAKASPAEKSKAAPKTLEEEIIVQYAGAEWSVSALKEKAIEAYIASGHRRGNIKKLSLYVKPEERKTYYVINGITGQIDFEA